MDIESKRHRVRSYSNLPGSLCIENKQTKQTRTVPKDSAPSAHEFAMMHEKAFDVWCVAALEDAA